MLRWTLFILGLAFGWSTFELKAGLIVGIVGFLIGRWFEERSSQPATPQRQVPNLAQEVAQLKQRINRLEDEVRALRTAANPNSNSTLNPAAAAEAVEIETVASTSSTSIPPTTQPALSDAGFQVGTQPAPARRVTRPVLPPTAKPSPLFALIAEGWNAAQAWLFGGNTVVRLGMIILFFGVSFLLKFAADNQMLPIQARLAGLSLGAALLFATGWRLRAARRSYALIMQGGALGLLYFTIYGAMKLYHLLPTTLAFGLLALLGVAAALLAIRQDASSLAVMGICGGFMAPILTSDGSGNHVLLFSYFALLNAGIFGIAWFKAWRSLNLLGFIFTYAIATTWGVLDYRSELRASTQPFVVIFWLFYAGISALYALKRSHSVRSIVDGTLVFGTPIITLALQSQLMSGVEYGMCYSALIGALGYFALAGYLQHRRDATLQLFIDAQIAIGVLLATLAIPLAFDGNVTAAMWAVEGAAVLWVSLRQERRLAMSFGLFLQFAAGIAVLSESDYYTSTPFLNGVYFADLLIALAGLFCAWQLHEKQKDWPLKPRLIQLGWVVGAWGLLWLVKANLDEVERFFSFEVLQNAQILLAIFVAVTAQQLALRKIWRQVQILALAFAPFLLLLALTQYFHLNHFFDLWAWPFALIALFALLYQQDRHHDTHAEWQHTAAAWLSWGMFIDELSYWIGRNIHTGVSDLAIFAIVMSTALAAIKYLPWPVKAHRRAYWLFGTAPVALLLLLWGFYTALSGGDSGWPVLNALDLAQIAALAALAFWGKAAVRIANRPMPSAGYATLGAACFVWLNAMLLRTIHHQRDIDYTLDALVQSTVVQMSLSIFWTIIALALMLVATRKYWRILWLVGAALLAIVVGKLFLLDLSHISGIERIASFMGVGLLLLLIGYLAPIPPQQHDENQHQDGQD
ncbi:DUF2339 domain-containing protein [Chitinibacter bivalviorum]|uniref:DUF2339 domain-containing protein n=1 Tax=Chitinibacter bivalviorum TaxID=2739434 RepID=A0A7H9BMN9_9NEIS|nr:DUF2339 domain-containing protein [Chitinibacter bivalviorum]QLG88634.1 DUF2339 domain-containing protein [Chitinibacter bivalviorum]